MKKKETKFYQIPSEVFSYKNCWVALTPNGRKVLVTGKNLEKVLKASKTLGFKEPALIWAPKAWGLYILAHAIPLSKNSR